MALLKKVFLGYCSLSLGFNLMAFENTKVAPKGVRSLIFKNIHTSMNEKTNSNGDTIPLAEPLEKPLTIRRAISGEANPFKRAQLKAFVESKDQVGIDDAIGQFSADLNVTVDVLAPVFAMGLTDNITIALGGPIYHMTSNVAMGFNPNNENSSKIINILSNDLRQPGNAYEVYQKINQAVEEVRLKLAKNGFEDLGPWEKSGLGDLTLAMKHRIYSDDILGVSYQTGLVLPTGQPDSPDILTDLPMGDGQLDVFFGLAIDETLGHGIFWNQYAKYTYQAPGSKEVRLQTELEGIRVDKKNIAFKLGDKFDAGTSIMAELPSGYLSGIGITYYRKFGDRLNDVAKEVENYLTRESVQQAFYAEIRLGYSTIPAFKRKEFAVPLSINFDYKKQLSAKNRPIADLMKLDFSVFF